MFIVKYMTQYTHTFGDVIYSTSKLNGYLVYSLLTSPTTDSKSRTNSTNSFDNVSAHSFSHLQVDIPVLHLYIAFVTLGPHPL